MSPRLLALAASVLFSPLAALPSGESQHVLATTNLHPSSAGPAPLTRQNDSLCDAGAAQWTGTVALGEGRDMFFCASLDFEPWQPAIGPNHTQRVLREQEQPGNRSFDHLAKRVSWPRYQAA